jgi:transcriptional regulator with XRE-family HTH domain
MAERFTHLGQMLSLYRTARQWTVRDVAPQIGISIATLSRIERGNTMDAESMLKIWSWMLRPGGAR